jgi:hypothetical protein
MTARRAHDGEAGRSRGRSRELEVMATLVADGWPVVKRFAWGAADVFAAKLDDDGQPLIRLVQVKSTGGGPFERFGPSDRAQLLADAAACGAQAWLAWWPAYGSLQWGPSSKWPSKRARLEAMAS